MRFGAYFAYWEKEWACDYARYIEKVKRLGFDALEISGAGIMTMDDGELAAFGRKAEKAGVELSACIGLPKELDVSSLDEKVREAGTGYMKEMFGRLEKAGIDLLGGIIYSYWPADYSESPDKPAVRAASIKSMRELAAAAKKHNVTLALETVNRFEQFIINDAKEAVAFVEEIGAENVKVMLDSFHMNIEEDSMGGAIKTAGKHLGHFHIGECNRKVPGKGHMQWDEIGEALRDIGYDGRVVMEPFVRPGGGVGRDIKVWRDLSDGADEAKLDSDIAEALRFVKGCFCR